jgi:hypothetical protein
MSNEISRREFIKTATGCGAFVLLTTISPTTTFARNKRGRIQFKIKSGGHGCRHCGNTVKKLLKDRRMMNELERLFPKGATVTFYVKSQSPSMDVPDNGIVVGRCARAIKRKGDVFVYGCRREITKQLIFDTIKRNYSFTKKH